MLYHFQPTVKSPPAAMSLPATTTASEVPVTEFRATVSSASLFNSYIIS